MSLIVVLNSVYVNGLIVVAMGLLATMMFIYNFCICISLWVSKYGVKCALNHSWYATVIELAGKFSFLGEFHLVLFPSRARECYNMV
jgi:hypothetical protein